MVGENETGWVGLGSESGGETMYGPGQKRDRLEISEETEEQERRIRKTERGRDGRIGRVPPWDGREVARAVSNGWKDKKELKRQAAGDGKDRGRGVRPGGCRQTMCQAKAHGNGATVLGGSGLSG